MPRPAAYPGRPPRESMTARIRPNRLPGPPEVRDLTDPMNPALADHRVLQYRIVTGNYWIYTLANSALRVLLVLYFHQLGYTPLEIALLFLLYEFVGIFTNLVGGWLGARLGLGLVMHIGLFLQAVALSALLVPVTYLTVPWVMAALALSGIAKDLNKTSGKTSIRMLVSESEQGKLYRRAAILTGSKIPSRARVTFLAPYCSP